MRGGSSEGMTIGFLFSPAVEGKTLKQTPRREGDESFMRERKGNKSVSIHFTTSLKKKKKKKSLS